MRSASITPLHDFFWNFFWILFLVAQGGCVAQIPSSTEAEKFEAVETIDSLKNAVLDTRGLELKERVAIIAQDRASVEKSLAASLLEYYGPQKLENAPLSYAKLGLLPSGIDLKESLLNFYRSQALGFYDTKAKAIVIRKHLTNGIISSVSLDGRRESNDAVLFHELVHALQDQHFSIQERLRPSDNDDQRLALRSIIEGDAVLAELSFLVGKDSTSLAQEIQNLQNQLNTVGPTFLRVPALVADQLLFQYNAGTALVYRVLKEEGWTGVNRLYEHPPLSTEQVLHPEKYLTESDPPIRIDLPDLSILFSSEWRPLENNTLGELMIPCLFKEFFASEEARKAALGWGGDRFVAFRRRGEAGFVWATVWDSIRDAEDFFQKYHQLLLEKNPSHSLSNAYLERRGLTVIVVEGLEKSAVRAKIERIWQGIKLFNEPFQSPFPFPLATR